MPGLQAPVPRLSAATGPLEGLKRRLRDLESSVSLLKAKALLSGAQISGSRISPATLLGASQTGVIYMDSGAPDNAKGNNGDFYFRTGTPATSNQRVYVKAAGSWSGIL